MARRRTGVKFTESPKSTTSQIVAKVGSIIMLGLTLPAHSSTELGHDICGEYMRMGMQAYHEGNYTQVKENLSQADRCGIKTAGVLLAYIGLHENQSATTPGDLSPRDVIQGVIDKHGRKAIIFTGIFYQKTRTPEAAYLVGLAYYLHEERDKFLIGDKPAWKFWYDQSVEMGFAGPHYYNP